MREIKFRVWDKTQCRMFIPDGLKNPINFTENVEHMQFTGLHDKNGKEIYEGDVVNFDDDMWQIAWGARDAKFTLLTVGQRTNNAHIRSAGAPIRDFNWLDFGAKGYAQKKQRDFDIEIAPFALKARYTVH